GAFTDHERLAPVAGLVDQELRRGHRRRVEAVGGHVEAGAQEPLAQLRRRLRRVVGEEHEPPPRADQPADEAVGPPQRARAVAQDAVDAADESLHAGAAASRFQASPNPGTWVSKPRSRAMRSASANAASASPWVTKTRRGGVRTADSQRSSSPASAWPDIPF